MKSKFSKKSRVNPLRKKFPAVPKPIQYLKEVARLKKTIPDWDVMFVSDNDEESYLERIQQMIRVEVIGQSLCEKYSWAIPDERALNIIRQFSPIIEIGCGKGYWAYLLKERGVDVLPFDIIEDESCWTDVLNGGPEVLQNEKYSKDRTLMLCYPDEGSSLALNCLEFYTGKYLIHVGELAICGSVGTLSSPQSPWGRTTSAEFQEAVAEEFHCLLNVSIPRYPFSNDCLSVWKRTNWVEGKPIMEENDLTGESEEMSEFNAKKRKHLPQDDEMQDNIEDNMWASIPLDERLPTDIAAPCLAHLLAYPK